MTEQATERTVVRASVGRCFDVVTDFGRYVDWAPDIESVEVQDVDESGRGTQVRFQVTAFGRTATYTLAYDYAGAPEEVSWSQVEGDVTAGLAGRYVFRPSGEDDTEILYHLDVELRVPIPGFVRRRAEGRIIHTALGDLRARIEDGSGSGGRPDDGEAAGEVGRAP